MAITAKNKANEREVEMMFGKALCAYKNAMDVIDLDFHQYGLFKSEYEATCRCIAMFTVEHLPEVCQTIIDRAKSEFGL